MEKQFSYRTQTTLLTLYVITKNHTKLQGLLPSLSTNRELGFDPLPVHL